MLHLITPLKVLVDECKFPVFLSFLGVSILVFGDVMGIPDVRYSSPGDFFSVYVVGLPPSSHIV